MKHRLVESMSSSTADALGLSRAILCNGKRKTKKLSIRSFCCLDNLIKKLNELEQTANLYRGLIKHTHSVLKKMFELVFIHRDFGDAFANIGAREPQFKASEAFTKFGDAHRQIDRYASALLLTVKPVCNEMYSVLIIIGIILDDFRFKYISNKSYT